MRAANPPARFFNASQQQRLMDAWRKARDLEAFLPINEQSEPDALIEAELDASASRAALLADAVAGGANDGTRA